MLALSYCELPYEYKPCFLHLGSFPEESKIPAQKLYQMWAAEDFLILPLESYDGGPLLERASTQVHGAGSSRRINWKV